MSTIFLAAVAACTTLLGPPIDPARPYKQTGEFELIEDYCFTLPFEPYYPHKDAKQ